MMFMGIEGYIFGQIKKNFMGMMLLSGLLDSRLISLSIQYFYHGMMSFLLDLQGRISVIGNINVDSKMLEKKKDREIIWTLLLIV